MKQLLQFGLRLATGCQRHAVLGAMTRKPGCVGQHFGCPGMFSQVRNSSNQSDFHKSSGAPIKLYYFGFKGRAEPIRILLNYVGRPFEDIRVTEEEWVGMKKDAPFHSMPFIQINGTRYGQSMAILQHFAREHGLYGKTNMEAFTVDMCIQIYYELNSMGPNIMHEHNKEKKLQLIKHFTEFQYPRTFGNIETIYKQNNTGFAIGNEVTLADIVVFDMCDGVVKSMVPKLDKQKYPFIAGIEEKLSQDKRIKAYLDKRPVTKY